MFERSWIWIKEHPVYVIGGLGLLIILYFVFSSGSSSSGDSGGAVAASGPTDAEVQAAGAVQIAQLQGQEQGAQISAALSANANNNATRLALAQTSAQVANYQTEQQANVQQVGINAAAQVQEAGLQSQQVIALANNATQVAIQQSTDAVREAQINGVVQIANAPYAAQVATVTALAPALPALAKEAAGTKNSYLTLPGGITIGRNTPPSNVGAQIGQAAGGLASLIGVL